MVFIALIASLILTVGFYFRRRQLKAKGGKSFWYHFFDKSLEFLIPFTIIAGFFCLLSLFISGTSDRLTIQYLTWFEKALDWIRSFAGMFKLSALLTGVILIALYVVGLLPIFPRLNTGRLVPYLKKYKTVVQTVYMIIVIFFSFTFFGVQSEEPAAELRFRIKENEKLYGELRKEVETVVRKEVTDKLFLRIYHIFPNDYRVDMRRGDDGPNPPDDSPPKPPSGPNGGGGGSDDDDKGPIVYDLFDDPGSDGQALAPTPEPTPPVPSHASGNRIARAFEALRRYRLAFQTKFVKLFASETGRELAIQPPEILTDKFKDYVLKEMMDKHPILEAALDKVFDIVNKSLEPPVQKAVDKITGASMQDPEMMRQVINIEVSAIVNKTYIEPSYSFSDGVRKARAIISKKWQDFKSFLANPINQTAEEVARINEQIHLLTCPNEVNRLQAARNLSQGGARLTEPQVLQIKEVLKQEKWRIGISPTQEGMFVEVPVKYYAALALEGMFSRYVTSVDRVSAAEIIYEVETHPPSKQYSKDEVEKRMVA
jgi:hypothetical protein